MRFMVIVKANAESEAGIKPSTELMEKIRQVFEAEDFGSQFTDARRDAEERTREKIARYGRPATAER